MRGFSSSAPLSMASGSPGKSLSRAGAISGARGSKRAFAARCRRCAMPDRRPATARAATIAENGAEAAPASLHRRILADIEARILSGEWPPGHRIPFEHELTTQYGCSRMTVSKVLTQLARAGLIARRRRAGTFVTRPHSQAAVLEIHDIKAEAAALGRAYRFEIAARRKRKG